MKLLAISDLHVRHAANRHAVEALTPRPDDWLIVAGDVGETIQQVRWVLGFLRQRFARLVWVPGNHELWSPPGDPLRGVARYLALVDVARQAGADTPEDPPPLYQGDGGPALVVPLFLLYDYTFRPDDVAPERAVAWATASGVLCADERVLDPSPHPTRAAWCAERLRVSEERLDALPRDPPKVLVGHFPFRQDMVRLPRIPRFVPWCGTRATEGWHRRWNCRVVVHGHLHLRATDWRDGVRFEEVSLGYPRHWQQRRGADYYLREILPGPRVPSLDWAGPVWHR